MKYLLLFGLLISCSEKSPESPEETKISLCHIENSEDMTEFEKANLQKYSDKVSGQFLTFVGIVSDIQSADLWWKGPTLYLKPFNTDLTTVFGDLPKEWDKFQPPLKKKEKIKISGEGRGGCRSDILGNGYHIFMTVWELERVE